MIIEEGDQTTEAEKKEEETEDDPFSDIFDTEEKEEAENEEKEEKPQKKEETTKKKSTQQVTRRVDEIVDERITDAEKRLERRADVGDYLASDDGKIFSQYAKEIRQAALRPEFSRIPINQLAAVILKPSAYTKALDDARKAADEEAADSFSGGSTPRGSVPDELRKIDPTTMDDKEFQQLKQQALAGKFKIKK